MAFPTITDTGYVRVKDMFDVAPDASGNAWYFDPGASGDNSGSSPANAMRTAAHINAANFATGDRLLFRAGTVTTVTEKIRNNKMVGENLNPFYVGVYRMVNGSPVLGRGSEARPIIQGLDPASFDPYGGMTNSQLMAMVPTPENVSGTFSQGSLEGIFNWYRNETYDLYLWVDGLHVRYSGGRAFRFSQSTGGSATGLLVQDTLCEGTMKHSLHLTGVFDAVVENVGHTLTSCEIKYWNPSSNRQAATAVKGSKNDYDTSSNVWFVQNYVWDGFSSEGINTNSGNLDCSIVDCFIVDQGIYGIYIDRTRNALVERNVCIRTSRTAFDDWTSVGSDTGRGVCAIMMQNEKATGSFPWNVYDEEADFLKYGIHDCMVRNNFAAGWTNSWGFQSQASSATGEYHTGRDFGQRCYWYGNVSLHAVECHHMFDTFNQAPNYQIDMSNPPRFWGGIYLNDTDMSTDDPTNIGDLFNYNYFDFTPETEYNTGAVTSGLVMEDTNWDDLSYLMTVDADGHMTEENLLLFRDEILSRIKPSAAPNSGATTATFTDPTNFDMADEINVDFEGDTFGTNRKVGAFALNDDAPPVLSSPTASSITPYGMTPKVTTDTDNGELYMTVGPDGESSWRIDIVNGVLRDQSPALADDSATVTSSGEQTMSAVTGLSPSTAYELQFVQDNSDDQRSLKSFTGFTTAASAAPTLTSLSAGDISDISIEPSVSTTGIDGALYAVVVPDGDSPSVDQVKLGQQSNDEPAIAADAIAVNGAGSYEFSILAGLDADTSYELFSVHTTVDNVDSASVTTGFTTDSPPPPPVSDQPKGKTRKRKKRRRYVVEVDGEFFPVSSQAEAEEVLLKLREVAEEGAKVAPEGKPAPKVRVTVQGKPVKSTKISQAVETAQATINDAYELVSKMDQEKQLRDEIRQEIETEIVSKIREEYETLIALLL